MAAFKRPLNAGQHRYNIGFFKMANYNTSEFRSGLRIIIDSHPCIIVENEFVKPGKGQAFNRVRIKNLKTGKLWTRRSSLVKALRLRMSSIRICNTFILTASSGIS